MTIEERIYKATIRALQDYDLAKKRFENAKEAFDSLNHLQSPFFHVVPEKLEAAKQEYEEARKAFASIGI